MHEQPLDKNGKPISPGDTMIVRTHHGDVEGEVTKVVLTQPEADREGVKHPPKVCRTLLFGSPDMRLVLTSRQIILKDKDGNEAHHNPESLEHIDREKEYQSSREVGA
ncbi:hypothetical protein HJFPF1_00157 [Paramyrothecium foliicola]|nr:hypothetical protein HJFPF1_00157 [Paramyrothecium foliicola]